MDFIKWIILIALFAFAENSPTSRKSSNKDFLYDFNDIILEMRNPKSQVFNAEFERNKIEFTELDPNVLTLHIYKDNYTAEVEFLVSLEVHLHDFDRSFETEIFPFNFTEHGNATDLNSIHNTSISLEYPDLDIKLKLPSDHQYQPSEETIIKQKTRNLLKMVFDNRIRHYREEISWGGLSKAGKALFQRFAEIRTIPRTDYTLDNLTIEGLENIKKVEVYLPFVLRDWFGISVTTGPVRGSLMHKFHSRSTKPIHYNFKADSFTAFVNSTFHVFNITTEGYSYSFVNTKSNTTLTNDQSKSIMKRIESAFHHSEK